MYILNHRPVYFKNDTLSAANLEYLLKPLTSQQNLGRDPFNQNSDRSDREKELLRLDRTDLLSFGPKFLEILVEWIAPLQT